MAKRATKKAPAAPAAPPATRLPADWRNVCNWRVVAMMAKIPEDEYDAQAAKFEADRLYATSEDWRGEWRAWCRAELIRRSGAS